MPGSFFLKKKKTCVIPQYTHVLGLAVLNVGNSFMILFNQRSLIPDTTISICRFTQMGVADIIVDTATFMGTRMKKHFTIKFESIQCYKDFALL